MMDKETFVNTSMELKEILDNLKKLDSEREEILKQVDGKEMSDIPNDMQLKMQKNYEEYVALDERLKQLRKNADMKRKSNA